MAVRTGHESTSSPFTLLLCWALLSNGGGLATYTLTNSEVTAWRSLSHLRKNSKGINNSCHKLSIPEEYPSVRPRRKAFLLGHHVTSRVLFKTLKRGRGLPIYMTAEASWKPSWKAGLTSQGLSTFSLLWRLLKASLVFTLRSTV